MKKILLFASALAGLFLAGSCQRENLEPVQQGNTVTYTVTVPDALATKGIGDNVSNVNTLHYEVYRTAVANTTTFTDADRLLYHDHATVTNGTAKIELELVNDQNFTVLFWAQVGETNEAYDVTNLTNVTLKSSINANQVDYAAFSGVDFIQGTDALTDKTIELTRPVAQINLGTTEASLTAFDTRVGLDGSSMTVAGLSNTFNVAKQIPGAALTSTTVYAEKVVPTEKLTVNSTDYIYVGMNYAGFAPEVGTPVTVSYDINTTEGHIQNTIENVPVKPNYRTNIIGNLITSKTAYTVELDETWGVPAEEYEVWDGKTLTQPTTFNAAGEYLISKPSEWAWLANKQNPATKAAPAPIVINLTSDLDFGGHELTGLVALRSGSLTVNGNGYAVLNAKVVSGNNDNGTNAASLFISLPDSELKVENLDVKNVNVVTSGANPYAGVITSYVEGVVTIKNVNVYNSSVYGIDSIGAIAGFIPANGTVTVENVLVDGVKLANADVADESGAMGGFAGRVAGKLTAANVKVANTTIEAYVGTASDQKRSVAKFIGNFVGGGMINVTGASLENVTIVAKNELAQTQQCLYTEFLGGWRGNGGTVSINGIEITKDQTSGDVTIDTPAELSSALANAADGAVIPVAGAIETNALAVGNGKNVTIVGLSDGATINSSSARMHTSGNITFKNITMTLPTSNDYFGGHDANGGTMVFDNCKFVGTATTINGNFTYNNCEFTNPDKYAAWVYGNSVVTYNNCSFSGPDRAAKVFTDGGSEIKVAYNNCTFKATKKVNKTAVEIDCTRQTSGVPYYVTIINPTIENMGAAEHYAVGAEGVCNLKTSGAGLGIVNVDGKAYSVAHTAAQLESLTNAGKDVTIQFAQDIAGDFTYEQNDNETVVIDGNGKTMNGTINVRARADVDEAIPVVIKNINFQTTDAERSFILSSETNRYPLITVSGCTFEGPGAESGVVPVTIKSAKNFVMENCTATKVHSLIQNTSGWNITIRNCEVTESGRGMALGTVQGATIENVKIDALDTKYGIRMDAGYNNNATIKDCEISAFIPVVVRKASVNSTVVFNGTNTMTPANTDDLWCVIGTSEYEANGVMPTAPTAQVTVTLNDAGLNPAGVYGAANL